MGEQPAHTSLPAEGLFPATRRDWLATQVAAGDEGRKEANGFVMQLYGPALAAYLRGSRWRSFGNADDLVAGYFASRLDRDDFFAKWLASGLPFRRWLANGFLFYLREEARRRRHDAAGEDLGEDAADSGEPAAVERFEQAWAREVVRRACERAHEVCKAAGRESHWTLFVRHHVDGVPYAALAGELGIDPVRAPGMSRTTAAVLRRAFLEILVRDGVPQGELDDETDRLLAAFGR